MANTIAPYTTQLLVMQQSAVQRLVCTVHTCGHTVHTPVHDYLSAPKLAGAIILLRELDRQARLQGGAVYMLNGNHESLNVAGNFRHVHLDHGPLEFLIQPAVCIA